MSTSYPQNSTGEILEIIVQADSWGQILPDGKRIILTRPPGTNIGDQLRYTYRYETQELLYAPESISLEESQWMEKEMDQIHPAVHCNDDRIRCWHMREDCQLCCRCYLEENEKDKDDDTWIPNVNAMMNAEMAKHGIKDVPVMLVKESDLPVDHPHSYAGVNTRQLAENRQDEMMVAAMRGDEVTSMKVVRAQQISDITHARGGVQKLDVRECSSCGHRENKMRRCACQLAWYCNSKCQKKHWKHHKPICTGKKKKDRGKKKSKSKSNKTKSKSSEDNDNSSMTWEQCLRRANSTLKQDGMAQYLIGAAYLVGESDDFSVPENFIKNEKLGARYLYMSATNGNTVAMLRLGTCYAAGIGVKKSARRAKDWFLQVQKKAEKEQAPPSAAFNILGFLEKIDSDIMEENGEIMQIIGRATVVRMLSTSNNGKPSTGDLEGDLLKRTAMEVIKEMGLPSKQRKSTAVIDFEPTDDADDDAESCLKWNDVANCSARMSRNMILLADYVGENPDIGTMTLNFVDAYANVGMLSEMSKQEILKVIAECHEGKILSDVHHIVMNVEAYQQYMVLLNRTEPDEKVSAAAMQELIHEVKRELRLPPELRNMGPAAPWHSDKE